MEAQNPLTILNSRFNSSLNFFNYIQRGRIIFIAICLGLCLSVIHPLVAYADDPSFDVFEDFGGVETTTGLAVGDLDNDGDLDIVTANANSRPNYIFINNGRGNFTSHTALGNNTTKGIAIGDLNGDGALDIVAGNAGALSRIYFNDGLGTFGDGTPLGSITGTKNVIIGDLNGDGSLDIVAGSPVSPHQIYLNDGSGNFGPGVALGSSNMQSIALGDLNKDGALDIIVGNVQAQNQVYFNNGTGGFGAAVPFGSTDDAFALAVGDLDGDDDLDVVVGNYDDPSQVYTNDGAGNLSWVYDFPDAETTLALALGDVNGDGVLDLLIANEFGYPSRIYLNDGAGDLTNNGGNLLEPNSVTARAAALADLDNNGALDPILGRDGVRSGYYRNGSAGLYSDNNTFGTTEGTLNLVAGDLNGDGALDIVEGNGAWNWGCNCHLGQQNRIYLNDGQGNFPTTGIALGNTDTTYSHAIGDLDGDGDLDIVEGNSTEGNSSGQNQIYWNNGSGNFTTSTPLGSPDNTNVVVLGDLNSDGSLDIVVGNYQGTSLIYFNSGTGSFPTVVSLSDTQSDQVNDIALGDLNGDGALDMGVGNNLQFNKIYLNDGNGNFPTAQTFGLEDVTVEVVLADVNGDGALDIINGSYFGAQSRIYLNDGQANFGTGIPYGTSTGTQDVAVADLNGDGTLDIAESNQFSPGRVFLNDGSGQFDGPGEAIGNDNDVSNGLILADFNGDGRLDMVKGNDGNKNQIYSNLAQRAVRSPADLPFLTVSRPVPTGNADLYSTPIILTDSDISVRYTLFDSASRPAGRVVAFYSPDGGGRWLPAIPTADTPTTNLPTAPYPTTTLQNSHVFTWDTFASGFFGQSDNVVLRFELYPLPPAAAPGTYSYPNASAGPYQWPYASAQTFPFRVRGTQVQVISNTVPAANALVYRLPVGQTSGGFLLTDRDGEPFRTDVHGYLAGRGQIVPGDQLLALVPVPLSTDFQARFGDGVRLYYTNATPTENGLQAHTVTGAGIQTLNVSSENALLLFDLHISLEWDASNDPTYLQQLEFDLHRAAAYLYDFTDGQVALGQVTVHQNDDYSDFADVVVQTTNRLRPFAVQGGIVLTPTVDIDHPDITYEIGQVIMGSTWNRYGNAGQNLGQDWPLALAHELSHYLLFLDDTYLGLNDDDLLIPIDTQDPNDGCMGTAMGDVYSQINTEFIANPTYWNERCSNTLAGRTLQRPEWPTITSWYPWLKSPANQNAGPSLMPFRFSQITVLPPLTPTNSLADPTFLLDYANGQTSSSRGSGYLLRSTDEVPATYEKIISLGSPVGGQNRLLARGAQPGDRLCTFDPALQQYGCEVIAAGDERLFLEQDELWDPFVQLIPVDTTTFRLTARGIPADLDLRARLYPKYAAPTDAISLSESAGIYKGSFPEFKELPLTGHIQLWVEEPATENNPRRETIIAFSVGGNPPHSRGGGPHSRGGGPHSRGGGPHSRGGGAPAVSPDGQFIFFTVNPAVFDDNEFYTIQESASLPLLPPGKKALGVGYNLAAFPSDLTVDGSVSFQYLGQDALVEQIDENDLIIHFWNGQTWQALKTEISAYYNLASALSQGPGIYALLAGGTPPGITSFTPSVTTNATTMTLVIAGQDFLPPVQVSLVGGSAAFTQSAALSQSNVITAEFPPGLPAQEYQLFVVNGDKTTAQAKSTVSVFNPSSACFYDDFASGANQWEQSGDWSIVTIAPSDNQAMTDSGTGPYKNANDYGDGLLSYTTAITSLPINLANCPSPELTFRHDYVIAQVSGSQDVGQLEISTDNGLTWTTLASYSGGGVFDTGTQATLPSEWTNANWQTVTIPLDGYTGIVRLRFSLTVDTTVSDKGWVLDNLLVKSKTITSLPANTVYLPTIISNGD